MDAILLDGHFEALKLGYERAGVFDYDADHLKMLARGIKDKESDFLQGYHDQNGGWHRGFLGDIKSGDDPRYFNEDGTFRPGSLDARSDLYVGRMRGSANEAFAIASFEEDPETEFTWALGGTEDHCEDCPEIAAGSPYTQDTLYTYPGAGDTECLGRCLCILEREDGATGFANHNSGAAGPDAQDEEEEPLIGDPVSIGDSITPDSGIAKDLLGASLAAIDDSVLIDVADADRYKFMVGRLDPGELGVHSRAGLIAVDVAQAQQQSLMVAIHEIGHMVDASFLNAGRGRAALKGTRYGSEQARKGKGVLTGWWNAVKKSQAFKNLTAASKSEDVLPGVREFIKNYLLNEKELWARSFAQFVATSDEAKGEALNWQAAYNEVAAPGVSERIHWDAKDFEPIREEIEKAFAAKGWKQK